MDNFEIKVIEGYKEKICQLMPTRPFQKELTDMNITSNLDLHSPNDTIIDSDKNEILLNQVLQAPGKSSFKCLTTILKESNQLNSQTLADEMEEYCMHLRTSKFREHELYKKRFSAFGSLGEGTIKFKMLEFSESRVT